MQFLLKAILREEPPFTPIHDRNMGFVICAPDEATARGLADAESKSEGFGTWLDDALTSCVALTGSTTEIILVDYSA